MECKNCKNTFEGNFCNHCGQNAAVDRLNFRYLFYELPNGLFQLNHGFLFTIKELTFRPGHSIREFLLGRRKPHYRPISFLLLTTALYVLSTYLMDRNTFLDDFVSGFKSGIDDERDRPLLFYLDWLTKNQVYAALVVMPLFSAASFLAFLRSGYNYVEHLFLNIYITGQQMLIYLFLSFIFFKENIFIATPFLVGMIYNMWTFHQFFKDKKFFINLGLVLLTYIIFLIMILSLILLLAILINF